MRAYERLLKYVKVHTTSDPNSGTHPSTLRQFDLAKILVEELKELGLTDAHVDEHCYVYATLPAFSRPEHTEGREGFFHLTSMQGDVTTAHLGYIVRDHDAAKFAARKAQMQHIAACLNDRYGAGTVELDIKDSYYNMLEKIQPHFHLVENARKAIRAAGLEPIETPVRGGTDGATLSYMGLPCPNLGTGGFNFHGPCECITAEKMDQGVEILLNLVELYK